MIYSNGLPFYTEHPTQYTLHALLVDSYSNWREAIPNV